MATLQDVVSKVKVMAPILAQSLASLNPVSSILYTVISQVFCASKNDPDDLVNRIDADPEAALKLRKIEYDHLDTLKNLQVQDESNARDREIQITKLTGKRDIVLEILALLVVFGYFTICYLVIFKNIEIADHDIVNMLFGQLMAGFVMVLSYFFGSSNKVN